MSYAIICPAAVQPDADAILQHLDRCDAGAVHSEVSDMMDGTFKAWLAEQFR